MINSPYGAASWPQHRIWERRWVPNGNVDNLPSRLLFSDHANFDDFTLLFCWGRLRNVHTLKTHEPSYCSAHYIFCFATSSLPSPSWFAKGPYSCNCTEPFILYELQFAWGVGEIMWREKKIKLKACTKPVTPGCKLWPWKERLVENVLSRCRFNLRDFPSNYVLNCTIRSRLSTYQVFTSAT